MNTIAFKFKQDKVIDLFEANKKWDWLRISQQDKISCIVLYFEFFAFRK